MEAEVQRYGSTAPYRAKSNPRRKCPSKTDVCGSELGLPNFKIYHLKPSVSSS